MQLQDLLEYRSMNQQGFRKILKKHDKVTQSPMMQECMPEVEQAFTADAHSAIQHVRPHVPPPPTSHPAISHLHRQLPHVLRTCRPCTLASSTRSASRAMRLPADCCCQVSQWLPLTLFAYVPAPAGPHLTKLGHTAQCVARRPMHHHQRPDQLNTSGFWARICCAAALAHHRLTASARLQQSHHVLVLHAKLHNRTVDQSESALKALRQRSTLEYQRPTVWRDMAELERHNTVVRVEEHGGDADKKRARRRTTNTIVLLFSLAVFYALLTLQLLEEPSQNACFAMVVLLSLLWSTEALPLYVTSMLVPALTVVLGVLPDEDGVPLSAPRAADHVFRVCPPPLLVPCQYSTHLG